MRPGHCSARRGASDFLAESRLRSRCGDARQEVQLVAHGVAVRGARRAELGDPLCQLRVDRRGTRRIARDAFRHAGAGCTRHEEHPWQRIARIELGPASRVDGVAAVLLAPRQVRNARA